MAKITIKHNPQVQQIFSDLEEFRDFCVDQGYVFDERYLYSNRSKEYRQFTRMKEGKYVRNNWTEDSKD